MKQTQQGGEPTEVENAPASDVQEPKHEVIDTQMSHTDQEKAGKEEGGSHNEVSVRPHDDTSEVKKDEDSTMKHNNEMSSNSVAANKPRKTRELAYISRDNIIGDEKVTKVSQLNQAATAAQQSTLISSRTAKVQAKGVAGGPAGAIDVSKISARTLSKEQVAEYLQQLAR